MGSSLRVVVRAIKGTLNALALVLLAPAGLACWLERALYRGDAIFVLCTHLVATFPGIPGLFLRRAFYRLTLDYCAADVFIGFGALVSRRDARFERGVYIGPYALVGWAWIQEKSLIGSRASLLSGGHQHRLLPSGEWTATDTTSLTRIVIARNTWVGEGAILMAGTGESCMVAAGAVVSSPVPDRVMVAGNPARFVRSLAAGSE